VDPANNGEWLFSGQDRSFWQEGSALLAKLISSCEIPPFGKQPDGLGWSAALGSSPLSLTCPIADLSGAPSRGFGSTIGVPGPLRYALSTHSLEHPTAESKQGCTFELMTAVGDGHIPLTGVHAAAREVQRLRAEQQANLGVRLRRAFANLSDRAIQ
jgi:hypothetical protein